MGAPLREALYLRDIHTWAMNEHKEYLDKHRKFIDELSRHAVAHAANSQAADTTQQRAFRSVLNRT